MLPAVYTGQESSARRSDCTLECMMYRLNYFSSLLL